MIMNCKKNLVIMRNLKSDFIDEAYFILKNDVPEPLGRDVVDEANRILAEVRTGRKKRPPFSLPSFVGGAVSAGILSLIVFLLL